PNARPAETTRPPAPAVSAASSPPAAAPSKPETTAAAPVHNHVMAAASPQAQTVAQAQAPSKPANTAAAVGADAAAGRQVYRKCQACHSLEPGKNSLGPSLAGIFGKKSGEVPNFNYSAAMKEANIVW